MSCCDVTVVIEEQNSITVVVEDTDSAVIILEAEQGPPGPPGESAAIYINSAISLSGHRVVKTIPEGCTYADSTNIEDIGKILGVTFTSSDINTNAQVRIFSEIVENSWSFVLGPVYLGVNGYLTQTIPTTGFVQQIGIATAQNTLVIQIQPPIQLT